ncbi:hypothetical protein GX408_10385 [bacterium]|nr:hypothetical protein [bacterium]
MYPALEARNGKHIHLNLHSCRLRSTRGGRHLIPKEYKEELHKYIVGNFRNKKQKQIAINSIADHVHIFIGTKPSIALSDLVRNIKNNLSTFINEKKWMRGKFNWQEGFGVFSYGHSKIDAGRRHFTPTEFRLSGWCFAINFSSLRDY